MPHVMLTFQYASESATNRSGGPGAKRPPRPSAGTGDRQDGDRPTGRSQRPPRNDRGNADGEVDGEIQTNGSTVDRPSRSDGPKDTRGKKWEAAGRKAPGAALAAAKREKMGIVEGTGTKVVFD